MKRPCSGLERHSEGEFFINNLLVRIHFIIVMIRRTGLAPWEFEFLFSGSLTPTFREARTFSPVFKSQIFTWKSPGSGSRVEGIGCGVTGAGFWVKGSGFTIQGHWLGGGGVQGSGLRVSGLGFRVQGRRVPGLGLRVHVVQGSGFRVSGLGCRVHSRSGFTVEGLGIHPTQ